MNLYLTSYRIPAPEELLELIGKKPEEIRTAIIPNAKDYYAERARNVKIKTVTDYLDNLGLGSSVIDLRNYSEGDSLERRLEDFDFLWVMGGNTFCLRYQMCRSGFDQMILRLLRRGLVYGGESAGAVVAGTSLKGIELADEPAFADEVISEGLGLIPYFVLPHVDDDSFKEAVNSAREVHANTENRLELTNSQVAIIRDGQVSIVDGIHQG